MRAAGDHRGGARRDDGGAAEGAAQFGAWRRGSFATGAAAALVLVLVGISRTVFPPVSRYLRSSATLSPPLSCPVHPSTPQVLLLERITDCHIQNFAWTSLGEDRAADEADVSHINYDRAATLVLETSKRLTAELKRQRGRAAAAAARRVDKGASSCEEADAAAAVGVEVQQLNDLSNEVTLSSARILTKQGVVRTKLDKHHLALVR